MSAPEKDPENASVVRDNPDEQRYEIWDGEQLQGFAAYQKADRLIVFTHTEVDPAFEGQGVGGRLVRAALDDVRTQGLPVLPTCPFVQSFMRRHPEYADLDYRSSPTNTTSTATD